MKRPASIGGRSLPPASGKCFLCGRHLGQPRDGTMKLLEGKFRLCCRAERACLQERSKR